MVKYFLAFFLLFSSFCFSQDPYFERYSIEEGLPTSNVYSIFEDNEGYIWFTTDTGLLRFDGYDFINYSTDNGLADNEIFKIFQDSQERMWFLSLNGKLSFYKNNQFYNSESKSFLEKASQDQMIVDIIEGDGSKIYVLFKNGGVSIIDKHKVSKLKEESRSSYALWEYRNDKLVVNSKEIISLNTGNIILKYNIPSRVFMRYAEVKKGVYYYSIKNKIYLFNQGVSEHILTVDTNEIIHLSIIDGNLFIGTRNGLFLKTTTKTYHYFKDEQISFSLKDTQGNLWLSTLDSGIKFIPNESISNQVYNSKNKTVSSLFTDNKGNIWLGAFDVLYKKSKNEAATKLLNENVFGIKQIDDSVFIFSEQLFIYSERELKKIPIRVNDIIKTGTHYIIATSSYILKIPYKDFEFLKNHHSVSENELVKYILFKKRVNFLFSKKDVIYIGTSNGLYYLKEEKLIKILSKNKELESSIVSMLYDDANKLSLISTRSSGVVIMKNDETIQQLKISENLNSNSCNKVIKIDDNTYLVATNKGLNMISVKSDMIKVENINPILGIKDLSVNDIEIIDDIINVASSKGLLSFNKSIINNKNQKKPKLLLNKISVNGSELKELNQLNHTQNNIVFSFTGLSFSSYGEVAYEYRLNEDEAWVETKNKIIIFNSLQPKNYAFSIRAKGANNLSSETKTILFKIKPPFWKTTAFITLSSIFILGMVLFFFKQRMDKQNMRFKLERETLKNKQEKILLEKETAELEQKALRLQMNPHFIFNALNTIKGHYSVGDIKQANNYISKFSKLLRLILENHQQFISLDKEVEMLELYLKLVQLRYLNIFEFSIHISEEIMTDTIGIPPLLLQPIVENAIIHGIAPNSEVKGELKISFKIEEEKLICEVVDNGIGISASKINKKVIHQSKALKITEERIDLINDIKNPDNFKILELKKTTGTRVVIKLPIIKI